MRTLTCSKVQTGSSSVIRIAATVAAWMSGPLFVGTFLRFAFVQGAGLSWQAVGLACTLAAFALFVLVRARPASGGVLEFAGESVRISPADGRRRRSRRWLTVTWRDVEDAYVVTPSRLVLRLRAGTRIDLEFEADEARDVARHLRATVEQRVLRTRTEEKVTAFLFLYVTMCLALASTWLLGRGQLVGLFVSFLVVVVCAVVLGRWLRPWCLETGVDGVGLISARGVRRRFIPYETIQRVSRTHQRIVLETILGTVRTRHIDGSEEALSALVSRIEARRATAAHAHPFDLLERGERSIEEWRTALDELALGAKGFRGAALHDDDLQRILEHPGAPLEQRIGAALALRSRGGDAQGRIRVAAETCVERRVRVALEAAAADDIDGRAIERALDKAEPRRRVAAHEPREDEG